MESQHSEAGARARLGKRSLGQVLVHLELVTARVPLVAAKRATARYGSGVR